MKLYEVEGKMLFQSFGIPIAKGWFWNEISEEAVFPLIAKVQVLTGGRGKLGGIQKVKDRPDLQEKVNSLMKKDFNGETVAQIYVEEIVDYQKEIYFSIVIDRNEKCPVLIVSGNGGINIEDVPEEEILIIPISPLIGLQSFMLRKVALFLGIDYKVISPIIEKSWKLFKEEQAELVEINPLFILNSGECLAGDAKVTLDSQIGRIDNPIIIPRNHSNFESRCSKIGAVGVELEGDIAVITSGAGLGMATYDLICSQGNSVRTLVDLGGHVIHDKQAAISLITEISSLSPKGLLFNFFFQVASCTVIADAIKEVLGDTSYPVVVRLKGKDVEEASNLLDKFPNIFTTQSLNEACSEIKARVEGDKVNGYNRR